MKLFITVLLPLCLSHLCSSLSWDVNHRMRPAAGKTLKRIADELETSSSDLLSSSFFLIWPLFLHHFFFCWDSMQDTAVYTFRSQKKSWKNHVSKYLFKGRCPFQKWRQVRGRVKVMSNQALSWISSSSSIPPISWPAEGQDVGEGWTDYIWQPKPF